MALALFSACADNGKEDARRILTEAQGQYDKGNYKESLRLVDSLRRSHPEAVEERRQALTLYQDASEKLAQSEIARLDMQLQAAQWWILIPEATAMQPSTSSPDCASRETPFRWRSTPVCHGQTDKRETQGIVCMRKGKRGENAVAMTSGDCL